MPSNADLRKQENQELYAEHKDSIHEVILTGEMLREEDPTSKLLFGYVHLFIIVRTLPCSSSP